MINIRRRDSFNFYESFSDLIFCTLVLFLVLVLFLSLNVNRRIENIEAVEQDLESENKQITAISQQLENKQADAAILKGRLAAQLENVNKLDSLEARTAKLKEELEIKEAQITIRKEKLTNQTNTPQELESREVHLASLQKELKSWEAKIAKLNEKYGAEVERIKELEKLKESAVFEDTETGKIYNLSGSKGHGIMVPCYWHHRVVLVVDRRSGKMTFEGQPTTWEQLPDLLSKVPYRHRTMLCLALVEQMSYRQSMLFWRGSGPITERITTLYKGFGFDGRGWIGDYPLGTRAAEIRPPILRPYRPYRY